MSDPKYPDISVQLTGNDGNAFSILGACAREARRAKIPAEELEKFRQEAMAGDYDNLLRVCTQWFNVN